MYIISTIELPET